MDQWQQLAQTIQRRGQAAVDAAAREIDNVMDDVKADAQDLAPKSPVNEYLNGTTGGRKDTAKNRGKGKRKKNPYWTGHSGELQASAVITPCKLVDGVLAGRVAFTAPHAAPVHEDTDARHGARLLADEPGLTGVNPKGQAKFLSIPMLKRRRSAIAQIAAAVERSGHV